MVWDEAALELDYIDYSSSRRGDRGEGRRRYEEVLVEANEKPNGHFGGSFGYWLTPTDPIILGPDGGVGITCDQLGALLGPVAWINGEGPYLWIKGLLIIIQELGDGTTTTDLELLIDGARTYELTENKITFVIEKDRAGVIPTSYWGRPLEYIFVVPPWNQSVQNNLDNLFNIVDPRKALLEEIRREYPDSQPIIRILDVDISSGASKTGIEVFNWWYVSSVPRPP